MVAACAMLGALALETRSREWVVKDGGVEAVLEVLEDPTLAQNRQLLMAGSDVLQFCIIQA